jgi:FKBP-type peptidyl-prolyl cis-trans isomerase SlyD
MSEEIKKVKNGVVVKIDYSLSVDGELLDSSKEQGPLEYLQGSDNIVIGLEKEIMGHSVGDEIKVSVSPDEGYGVFDEAALMEVPLSEFPNELQLKTGLELEVTDVDENIMLATVTEVGTESVKLDTNHPLAGKVLDFEVKITGIRPATEEEVEHGHVHSGHHHH